MLWLASSCAFSSQSVTAIAGTPEPIETHPAASVWPERTAAAAVPESLAALSWPEGTTVLHFEDLEGAILLEASLSSGSGRDTTGIFVFDTGAGFLALDRDLARILGLGVGAGRGASVDMAARPLGRLQVGDLQVDQVFPVLTVDAGVVRRATGQTVLGLLGQALFHDRVIVLDYREGTLVILPPEPDPAPRSPVPAGAMSARAVGVPFRLAGSGKVVIPARIRAGQGSPWVNLTLILDTGATKSVFFRTALDRRVLGWKTWPSLRGLGAPTLTGDASAELVRVPKIELRGPLGTVTRSEMDAAVLGGNLGEVLTADVSEVVDGLLGYSFLKHYRIAMDFPRGRLWLDPSRGDVADRPEEYSHPGLQLESVDGEARVLAVADDSPAARADIRAGDEILEIDGVAVSGLDVVEASRRLEGPPGTVLSLRVRRGPDEWTCRIVRRRLL